MINRLLTGLVCVGILSQCSGPRDPKEVSVGLPFYSQADFTPEWFDDEAIGNANIHTIAPFKLVNQNGDTITESDLKGKVYVANFFFTICPMICPKMTDNLERVVVEFEHDDSVLLVSHTVMPWVDSVAVLHDFAERRGIQSDKWHLLTGEKDDLYTLGRESYFADEGFGKSVTADSDFLHTENVVLVDSQLRIRGIYNGTLQLEMSRLIEDIRRLKGET
ncbi:MAG: SCO family protein [Imperialibacter sp.]|uniref:SCO family protein n=1 Tax=Imperialibacter sp. TaxID=2038411 RepID=UPI0032EEAA81